MLGYTGLTSITAMKLAVEVNKRYGIELDAKSMAKEVTIQSIENEIIKSLMDGGRSKKTIPRDSWQRPENWLKS